MFEGRESLEFDVLIIGAGPAGLACAIRYAQLCKESNKNLSICVLEKAAQIGGHTVSGAVIEPQAITELLPDWQNLNSPIQTKAKNDKFFFLTENNFFKLPTPKPMHNTGNYIVSLSEVVKWLGEQAENLGVEIYPGFAARQPILQDNKLIGVITNDLGLNKLGEKTANYQLGMAILAKHTILAEGCRGSVSKEIIKKFKLESKKSVQTYGIGIKEVWEVEKSMHEPGEIWHTIGWPLDNATYGGSFAYQFNDNLLSIGFVIGLDYKNPYLDPYQEFQRFKHHKLIKPLLKNGNCLQYGARAINEGGWQALPKLSFPGGMFIGCSAGFLNVPKIKGTHTAIKSGIIAAESIFHTQDYQANIETSSIKSELYKVRNIRPSFKYGLIPGLVYSAIDNYIFQGHVPWTFKNHADHLCLKSAKNSKPIDYPKPDGVISFDKLTSVSRSNVYHSEDQPCHLQIINKKIPIEVNWNEFRGPEGRYCPAKVYEYLQNQDGEYYLQINAQNCIHCKTCDIKDFSQNINWVPPQGGEGPNYSKT